VFFLSFPTQNGMDNYIWVQSSLQFHYYV
jgi:hypothetical protein